MDERANMEWIRRMTGKHRAPEPLPPLPRPSQPKAGKGQIKADPNNPGYDLPQTFGTGWT